MERIKHLAPFLYTDSDPYAVTRGDGINWMLNGMTTTTRYPYSVTGGAGRQVGPSHPDAAADALGQLRSRLGQGDGDAYTGQIQLYKFADEPIVNTWADIYPDLFKDEGVDAAEAARAGAVPGPAHARPVRRRLHLLRT